MQYKIFRYTSHTYAYNDLKGLFKAFNIKREEDLFLSV